MDASELVDGFRIVPVVVLDDADLAVPLAETLLENGIGIIEITLRTKAALQAIELTASRVPDMLVGAGSIRRASQFAEVADAGARFAVSPGTSEALLDAAADRGIGFIPGAATPSEMIVLLERGYTLQKFFPAEAAGGVRLLKSLASPLPEIRFMPTGGITADLASSYLSLSNVSGVGGSWLTPAKLLADREFGRIGKLAADAALLGI